VPGRERAQRSGRPPIPRPGGSERSEAGGLPYLAREGASEAKRAVPRTSLGSERSEAGGSPNVQDDNCQCPQAPRGPNPSALKTMTAVAVVLLLRVATTTFSF